MNPDEKTLFLDAMDDVKPLKPSTTVVHLKPVSAKTVLPHIDETEPDNFLITGFLDLFSCEIPLEFRREGIQQGVVDKLRQGKYPLDASLNLLRQPVEVCRQNLFAFMLQAQKDNLRNLLIIHGKSRHEKSHANVVRNYLFRWLQQFDAVQAFCTAQPFHGGAGACYVSLKKSDQARQDNRERHAKRSR
ncbi:DNA endonuclease SmrA [Dickeya dadantii]|uniref:DNA endonuclease SmrA n=1 Tax=Dickeya dadantii TaxID=204038 RepID=UPI000981729E|nr:DNA endonuclease SmrA [Dickeya dadantii]MCL6408134.1 DNA endonuclease SmrA [Dickeya dadantii]NAT79957.1 DNA endonuclease SmrA [Dickeya dadantii]NPE56041.1 DNA endonuclease SmrA [Dickeya dadantii]NPE65204.1 DNA endonuclease SmrA [Dickeya dadantii]NPE69217.1 DNA endonuclease SmrA [Dickeya dadantii]